MSVAEIRAAIAKLNPQEKAKLREGLAINRLEDEAYLDEIARRARDMERGINVVSREQMYERLRAAGIDV